MEVGGSIVFMETLTTKTNSTFVEAPKEGFDEKKGSNGTHAEI